jgi:hypothetical protein
MSEKTENKIISNQEPTKVESMSFTVMGIANSVPPMPGLTSYQSNSYTFGATPDLFDGDSCAEPPEPFRAGAVRSLKGRLRSRVSESSFLRDPNGEI